MSTTTTLRRPVRPTLDGLPARIHYPVEGPARVQVIGGNRYLELDQDRARDIIRNGSGAFSSPAWRGGKVAAA